MLGLRGGRAVLDFPSKLICLRVTKHFSKEPFCAAFQKNSGSEKVMPKKGLSRCSMDIFFVS